MIELAMFCAFSNTHKKPEHREQAHSYAKGEAARDVISGDRELAISQAVRAGRSPRSGRSRSITRSGRAMTDMSFGLRSEPVHDPSVGLESPVVSTQTSTQTGIQRLDIDDGPGSSSRRRRKRFSTAEGPVIQ
jgi:hypothetical protein